VTYEIQNVVGICESAFIFIISVKIYNNCFSVVCEETTSVVLQ